MNNIPFFDLKSLIISEQDQLHGCLDEVINSGFFIGGPITEKFENEFASYLGAKYVVGVGNGLDAIRLILEAYGVGPGDEVIVPAFTYYATWLAVIQTGARPVPVDVLSTTANINVDLVEAAITSSTKAIIAVHLYGQAADMKPLKELSEQHGLKLIEDAAQSHGAMSTNGMTGNAGDAAAFSFYPTKNLGGLGDGGAISTNDLDLAQRIISRRSYGQGTTKYDHVDTGWNSRLDPLQAAFLSLHLKKFNDWTDKRKLIAKRYVSSLSGFSNSVIGQKSPMESVWHHFILKSADRTELQKFFSENGISTDVHYPYSISELAPMRNALSSVALATSYPAAEKLANQVLSLPMGPWMDEKQITRVSEVLKAIPKHLLIS